MSDPAQWDVVVIGAGPAGENAAQYATQFSGLSAVLVEDELVGGECSYWACMPSKALLRPVEALAQARRVPGAAGPATGGVDVSAVLARRDAVVSGHDDSGQVQWARTAGIEVVRGRARLAGERRVVVTSADGTTRELTAGRAVVLATGSRAVVPDVPGLVAARPWTSRDVTNLHEVPGRVVVIGGGVVACEAATWLAGLGARVTMLVRGKGLLDRAEPFAGELVAAGLVAAGVDIRYGASAATVYRRDVGDTGEGYRHGGPVTVTVDSGEAIEADELVVATGRVPNVDGLGLASVGLADGPIRVDEHGRVVGAGGAWLYAVGDVSGQAPLTHMGKYQARVVGEVIAGERNPLAERRIARRADLADTVAVPQVVFTDPPVSWVGATQASALAGGAAVEVVDHDLAALAGTYVYADNYVGRARLVVDSATDTLIGATFVGAGTVELLHSATVAIVARVPVETLWHAVPSYPTISEVWLRLLEALDRQRVSG